MFSSAVSFGLPGRIHTHGAAVRLSCSTRGKELATSSQRNQEGLSQGAVTQEAAVTIGSEFATLNLPIGELAKRIKSLNHK